MNRDYRDAHGAALVKTVCWIVGIILWAGFIGLLATQHLAHWW